MMQFYIGLYMLLMLVYGSSNQVRNLPWTTPWFRISNGDRNEAEVALKVASWRPGDKDNPWERSGFFEGDILTTRNRNAVSLSSMLWPRGVVPYTIDVRVFRPWEVVAILRAMADISLVSCVRFRPRMYGDRDFLLISGRRSGCFSFVGRQGGAQLVNLQSGGCFAGGAPAHELLHALGFYHQHSVADRNEYINILWKNVVPDHFRDFMVVAPKDFSNLGVPYDYNSIMHYSSYIFSKNGQPTIVVKGTNETLSAHPIFSRGDIIKLQRLYKCSNTPPSIIG